jgi:NAD(P)-dependent dehydrogenase (short-subunit alcohol dehydrogenase family)
MYGHPGRLPYGADRAMVQPSDVRPRKGGAMVEVDRELAGQVAIVTGASRGLGQAFAVELSAAGAALSLMARSAEGLRETRTMITELGGTALCFTADVTDEAAAARIVAATEAELGPVDLLVNNAGTANVGLLSDAPLDDWWRTVEVNLRGPVIWMMAVLPGMLERGRGRIINITSPAARGPLPYYSSYCASKAGLTHLTATLAEELDGTGVVAHALAPEALTDLTRLTWENDVVPLETREAFRRYFTSKGERSLRQSVELLRFVAAGGADHLPGEYVGAGDGVVESPDDLRARKPADT